MHQTLRPWALIPMPGNTAGCKLDDGTTEKATHAPTKKWKSVL